MELPRLLWLAYSFVMALLAPCIFFHFKPHTLKTRLALTLPLLPACFVCHALLRPPQVRALLAFTLCWAIPNRLLLLCFSSELDFPAWSFSNPFHFMVSLLLPIRIKGPCSPSAHLASHLRVLLREIFALLFVALCMAFVPTRAQYPFVFLSMFLTIDLPNRVASIAFHVLYGVELHGAFNNPWLPQSLTEFWGRRWNLGANALLRQSVYNPVIAHLSARRRRPKEVIDVGGAAETVDEVELWVRVAGVCATFLCSGLIHELMWFCILQESRWASWENTLFFALHGVATSAEISVRRLLPQLSLKIPRFLKLVFTLAFIHTTMAWLLFAPQSSMPKGF